LAWWPLQHWNHRPTSPGVRTSPETKRCVTDCNVLLLAALSRERSRVGTQWITFTSSSSIQAHRILASTLLSAMGGRQIIPPEQSGTKMSRKNASKVGEISWLV